MRQDAVLPHHGHKVRGDGHDLQVQQRFQGLEVDVVFLGIALDELEAHAAAAQVVEGIVVVLPLGVQHRHGAGKLVLREVVVANDHVDALAAGVLHLLNGLDAAVQGDKEVDAVVRGPVQAFVRDAVALVIAVGNVVFHPLGEAADEGIDQGDGRRSVHVVIAVNQDFLAFGDGLVEPFHGLVHVLHQEWVVEVVEAGPEEAAGLLESFHTALDQQLRQNPVYTELRRQPSHLFRITRRMDGPFTFRDAHSRTKLRKSIGKNKKETRRMA